MLQCIKLTQKLKGLARVSLHFKRFYNYCRQR